MTLDELKYPFQVFASASHIKDRDLSFGYHVLLSDEKSRALCNDIPCQICQFSCKDGLNRQEVLLDFARSNFPEMLI